MGIAPIQGFGSTLGSTIEVSEIESLSDGHIIIGDGSGAPTTRQVFEVWNGGFLIHVRAPDASEASPAYSFQSDTNTGINWISADFFGLVTGATFRVGIDTTKLFLKSDMALSWSASTLGAAADTGLYRNAAGVLEIHNGTPGTFRDLKCRYVFTDDGVAGTPALAPTSDPNTGVYFPRLGTDPTVSFTGDGTAYLAARPGFLEILETCSIRWCDSIGGSASLAFKRSASGVAEINNGTAGQYRDLILRTLYQGKGADVASATGITLGRDGNYYDITGTTQIDRINSTGWVAGSFVVLQFDGSVTVRHNQADSGAELGLLLAGAANFSATANDTLMLVYDGAKWREVSRTAI